MNYKPTCFHVENLIFFSAVMNMNKALADFRFALLNCVLLTIIFTLIYLLSDAPINNVEFAHVSWNKFTGFNWRSFQSNEEKINLPEECQKEGDFHQKSNKVKILQCVQLER